jgi:cold shock CspA family protein
VKDKTQRDVFVHIKETRGVHDLAEGDVLEFQIGTDPHNGKPYAINIKRIQNVLDTKATT